MKANCQPVECNDGFKMSIQASRTHYCSPKNDDGPYIEVEIGMPNRAEPLLLEYAEDRSNPCGTVYGYVPSVVVLEVLMKHGGFITGDLPPMIYAASDHYPNEV